MKSELLAAAVWCLIGTVNIPIMVNISTKVPFTRGDVVLIVLTGPLGLFITTALWIANDTVCAFNCEAKK